MEYGKYIIVESYISISEMAIMFDSLISHDELCGAFNRDRIVSAGFFVVEAASSDEHHQDIDVSVFGKSVTLKLECRKDKDERLIKKVLRKEY